MIKDIADSPTKLLNLLKWLFLGLAVLWLGAAGWREFGDFRLPRYLQSNYLETKASACEGDTFLEIYDCKLDIRIAAGRKTFGILIFKFIVLLVPPIVLGIAYTYISRRFWRDAEEVRKRHHMERLAHPASAPPPPPPAASS